MRRIWLFGMLLMLLSACEDQGLKIERFQVGMGEPGYFIRAIRGNDKISMGGAVLIISGFSNNNNTAIYYLADDYYLGVTNTTNMFGDVSLYYSDRYWMGVSSNSVSCSYSWKQLAQIPMKDREIFIKMEQELSNRIGLGRIFINKARTNVDQTITELPYGILNSEQMRMITNFKFSSFYYELGCSKGGSFQ